MENKDKLEFKLNHLWKEVINTLEKSVPLGSKNSLKWGLKGSKLIEMREEEGIAVVLFEGEFQKAIVNDEFSNLINEIFSKISNTNFELLFLTRDEFSELKEGNEKISEIKSNVKKSDSLNFDFSFENFCVSEANKMVFAASRAVSIKPGGPWNPLFIYGGSGLGKTHLLNSIGIEALKKNSNLLVKFIDAKDFSKIIYEKLSNFSKNEINNEIDKLKDEFFEYDILLVDDIQFLSTLRKAKEIFFPIFNFFIENKKQVVIAADQYPEELKDFEHRFISRFSSGLVLDIVPPDIETAIDIIMLKIKKVHNFDPSLMTKETMIFMATNFSSNIRELEGSINRLIFWTIHKNYEGKIEEKDAREIFKEIVKKGNNITPSKIIQKVAKKYNISANEIKGKGRSKEIITPRQISIYLIRNILNYPLAKIGKEFDRNHSTIISSLKKIDDLKKEDKNFNNLIYELRRDISN